MLFKSCGTIRAKVILVNTTTPNTDSAAETQAAPTLLYHCACGAVTGERCTWHGPATQMVVVETMPECVRASHEAAGNRGRWPDNGALRIAVQHECADLLIYGTMTPGIDAEPTDDWTTEIAARVEEYAELS